MRADVVAVETLEPLFAWLDVPTRDPDPHFARHGWALPTLSRSGKSRPVPLYAPISFAFRLRRLLGIGVRAEVVRAPLTIRAPRVSSKVIAASAGFAQRNVRDGLSQLHDAGVLTVVEVADDRHFAINHDYWAALLGFEETPSLPLHYDWIPAFRALGAILRWLEQPGIDELSDYLRASQARTLLTRSRQTWATSASHRTCTRAWSPSSGTLRKRRPSGYPPPHHRPLAPMRRLPVGSGA